MSECPCRKSGDGFEVKSTLPLCYPPAPLAQWVPGQGCCGLWGPGEESGDQVAAPMTVAQSFLVPSIPFPPAAHPDFLKETGSSFSANRLWWEKHNCCSRKPFPGGEDPLRALGEVGQVGKQPEGGVDLATKHIEPSPLRSQQGTVRAKNRQFIHMHPSPCEGCSRHCAAIKTSS